MKCPSCDSPRIRVDRTQHDTDGSILRKRVCPACDQTWHTVEVELPAGGVMWVDRRLKRSKGFRSVVFQ